MKKILSIILISICTIIMITGCSKNIPNIENTENKINENKDYQETIKIMENVYVDYINDIYLDSNKYIGKTIEIEGMFTKLKDENSKNHLYVYRMADVSEHRHDEENCKYGNEDNHEVEVMCGLEFRYKGNIPEENDWIKVVGKLEEYDGNLSINADSIKIMKNRGLEKVKQFY